MNLDITDPLKSKDELERQKLTLEIRYMRRSFFLQAANVFSLLFLGSSVLFFFQLPQLRYEPHSRFR